MGSNFYIKVERSDSDMRFRDKCNENFQQLFRAILTIEPVIQLVGDHETVLDILAAMSDKVSYSQYNTDMSDKVSYSPYNTDMSDKVSYSQYNTDIAAINAKCPVPILGIYFTTSSVDPSTIWSGTTWESFVQSGVPANAWKRLT